MRFRVNWQKWISWVDRQGFHFVFVFSLTALTLLVAWWSVFLYRSVNEDYFNKVNSAYQSVLSYTLFLGHNALESPKPGVYYRDERLEIVASTTQPTPGAKQLLPFWEPYWLQPRVVLLKQLAQKHQRRLFMIVGESCLLVLLILISGFMIYRMYWLETRTTQELHELWSRVSHEIKTPITGVKAFLETLQAGHLTQAELGPLLELALKQVERQQQLTENMLVGQKLKRRGMGIQLTSLQLTPFLRHYIQSHPLSLAGNTLQLGSAFSETSFSSCQVMADPEALRIIFDNLLDNAVKYSGKDMACLTITFQLEQTRQKVRVMVTDNGSGFEPSMAESIFKAFKRLGNELPTTQHGTGMGLYICRRLARKMGGNLLAYSAGKGKGAQFILTLKATQPSFEK